jgi:tetratricopeptide (TPR) repeat protein
MLVTLPFVLLIMDYWPLNRIKNLECRIKNEEQGKKILNLFYEKMPLFILSAVSSVITAIAQKSAIVPMGILPLSQRISNMPVAYVGYILKMFWPVDLAALYPHPRGGLSGWMVALSTAALVVITVGVILLRRQRYLLAGWFLFLGTLVPVIGLVQVGRQATADRYTYIPLTGLFIMLVWSARDIISKWRYRKIIVGFGGSALIAVLGILSFRQVGYWCDTVTLFTHTTAVTKNNVLAHNELGMFYLNKGDLAGALHQFEQALKIEPRSIVTFYYAADTLAKQGRTDEAIKIYNRVLEIDPNSAAAQEALKKLKEAEASAAPMESGQPVNP